MTWLNLDTLQKDSRAQLNRARKMVESVQDSYPASANSPLPSHMLSLIQRVTELLDHPVLFFFHAIVYLRRAVKCSAQWSRSLKSLNLSRKNAPPANPAETDSSLSISPDNSSSPSNPPAGPGCPASPVPPIAPVTPMPAEEPVSPDSALQTPVSIVPPAPAAELSSAPESDLRAGKTETSASAPEPPFPAPKPSGHSLETRLRLRAWCKGILHERHQTDLFPKDATPPDITPIPSIAPNTRPRSSAARNPLSDNFPLPSIFPTPAVWSALVAALQARILKNLTRAEANFRHQIRTRPISHKDALKTLRRVWPHLYPPDPAEEAIPSESPETSDLSDPSGSSAPSDPSSESPSPSRESGRGEGGFADTLSPPPAPSPSEDSHSPP